VEYISPQTTSSQIFIIVSVSSKGLLPHYKTPRSQPWRACCALQAYPTLEHNCIFVC